MSWKSNFPFLSFRFAAFQAKNFILSFKIERGKNLLNIQVHIASIIFPLLLLINVKHGTLDRVNFSRVPIIRFLHNFLTFLLQASAAKNSCVVKFNYNSPYLIQQAAESGCRSKLTAFMVILIFKTWGKNFKELLINPSFPPITDFSS